MDSPNCPPSAEISLVSHYDGEEKAAWALYLGDDPEDVVASARCYELAVQAMHDAVEFAEAARDGKLETDWGDQPEPVQSNVCGNILLDGRVIAHGVSGYGFQGTKTDFEKAVSAIATLKGRDFEVFEDRIRWDLSQRQSSPA